MEPKNSSVILKISNEENAVTLCSFGARVTSWIIKKEGQEREITVAYDQPEMYYDASKGTTSFGAIMGRYANRISGPSFKIDGKVVELLNSEGTDVLTHAGPFGLHRREWSAQKDSETQVTFSIVCPDMEAGFPGDLKIKAIYQLDKSDLVIRFEATTNKATHVNLTNHCYFNFNSEHTSSIDNHSLQVESDAFLEPDSRKVPTGKLLMVENLPRYDFRKSQSLKEAGKDLDFCYVLRKGNTKEVQKVATLEAPCPPVVGLEVWTTLPGLQVYTGDFTGKGFKTRQFDKELEGRCSICLEAQQFPDGPNLAEKNPSLAEQIKTLVTPEAPLSETIIYRVLSS